MASKVPQNKVSKAALATSTAAVPSMGDAAPAAVAAEMPVAAAAAVEVVANTVDTMREAASPASLQQKGTIMSETFEKVKAQGEQVVSEIKDRAEGAVAKGKAVMGDVAEFNKGNLEAMVESGKIAAKGIERMGQDAADYARRSFEHTTSAFKGMAQVKSPTELFQLHNDFVRSSFDMFVAEASRSTEASLKLAGEIAQPISNRFAVAAEKVKLAA